MSISGLSRGMVGSVAILGVTAGCSKQEPTDCDAWELALEAREAAEQAMAVLQYEAEQLDDWISADSTAAAWSEAAWDLVPEADSAAASAWNEALAALEAVDSAAPGTLTAAEALASRYPDGLSTTALEAVHEAATAAAAAFEAVGAQCPRGPPRAAPLRLDTVADSAPDGCAVRAWAVAAEAEGAVAVEALWRAHWLSVLADSLLLGASKNSVLSMCGDKPVRVYKTDFRCDIA